MRIYILIIVLLAVLGITTLSLSKKKSSDAIVVGILQTASHRALDQARIGFINQLKNRLGEKIQFVYQNAEGSLSQAQTIAQSFHSNSNIKAIYAIATPAVQMVCNVEKEKPILISAVSDPDSLGLKKKGSNVCGTSDKLDPYAQMKLIKNLFPEVQSIAILYNPSEHNSIVMIRRMIEEMEGNNIKPIKIAVHTSSEIVNAVITASRKADCILIPADNLLVSCMTLLAETAINQKTPLIISDTSSVKLGALAARGVDYNMCGKITADLAYDILINDKSPQEVGIVDPDNRLILINEITRKALGIELDIDLISMASIFDEEDIQ